MSFYLAICKMSVKSSTFHSAWHLKMSKYRPVTLGPSPPVCLTLPIHTGMYIKPSRMYYLQPKYSGTVLKSDFEVRILNIYQKGIFYLVFKFTSTNICRIAITLVSSKGELKNR